MLKTIFICIATQALIVKNTHSQCIGRSQYDIDYAGSFSPFVYDGLRNSPFPFGLSSFGLSSAFKTPYGPMSLFPNFPYSKITSTGSPRMSVLSENIVEGLVSVAGTLPFIATVGIEGTFPTSGTGVVNYNCGNIVGIFNEWPGSVLESIPIVTPTFAPAMAPILPAYGYPFAGYDCGFSPFSYGPVGYDAYIGDIGYGPINYGLGPLNYGSNYDIAYIDGCYGNNYNGYGYSAVY